MLFLLLTARASFPFAFDVYIQSNFKNQPNFANYGIKNPAMLYGGKLFGSKENNDVLPTQSKTTSYVQKHFGTHPGLLAIDIESWGVQGSDEKVMNNVAKYLTNWNG